MKYKNICNFLMKYQDEKLNRFSSICDILQQFYEKKEKMKLRGFNDFNYIDLLKGYYDENTHSKIIAEFLNPEGSHYQGSIFLDKFLDIIGKQNSNKNWKVQTEFFVENCIGNGQGRIDIFLYNDSNEFIIVENKIFAGDQQSQIKKYVECIKKGDSSKKILVIYLTLDGKKPSEWSLDGYTIENENLLENGNFVADIKLLSYKTDILEWLSRCISDIENISNLKEALKQYKKAVESVTDMEENIMNLKDFLSKDENKEILIDLIENFDEFYMFLKRSNGLCKKNIEQEQLEVIIEQIKYQIRKNIANKIKEFLKKEKYNVIEGHEPFGTFAKMSYLLFTKTNLKYGYILFFANQNIYNLKLGRINCEQIDTKDIVNIKEKCLEYYCYELIVKQKCFDINHIDSFNDNKMYILII